MKYNKNTKQSNCTSYTINQLSMPKFNRLSIAFLSKPKTLALLMPLLLVPLSFSSQALSATTVNTIRGTAPYLTLDNGVTKITDANSLLSIKIGGDTYISDSTGNMKKVGPGGALTDVSLVVLQNVNDTLADVDMLVPTTANTIDLETLISAPYNYWKDDDDDGLGTGGVSATGSISVAITDNSGNSVGRNDNLEVCKGPYNIVLTSTDLSLTTQYGAPNKSDLNQSSATYHVSPVANPTICFAQPSLQLPNPGPETMWNPKNGFLPQSTSSGNYGDNFPTTGANKFSFDLIVGGGKPEWTWADVTQGDITAKLTPNDNGTKIRVVLEGPTGSDLSPPSGTFPLTFELVGKEGTTTKVKYGFQLQKWYINRGTVRDTVLSQGQWCTDRGYRHSSVADLTNASGPWVGGTPASPNMQYTRAIGAGLFSEWGAVQLYPGAGYVTFAYWTADPNGAGVGISQWGVNVPTGLPGASNPAYAYYGSCTYP